VKRALCVCVALAAFLAGASVRSTSAATASGAFPETVRIGVFTLFRTHRVGCATLRNATTACNDAGVRRVIRPGDRCAIVAEGGRVRLIRESDAGAVHLLDGERVELEDTARSGARIELEAFGRRTRLTRRFAGALAFSNQNGALRIVVTQKTEDATAAIVASEMSGVRFGEALRTMAVVVRSYLVAHAGRHAAEGYDFCDNTHCQLYFGESSERVGDIGTPDLRHVFDLSAEATQATQATAGEILTCAGVPVAGYFTASCGGRTAAAADAFGDGSETTARGDAGVVCEWCKNAKFHRWRRTVNAAAVARTLSVEWGGRPPERASLQVARRTAAGLVAAVGISDGRRTVVIPNTRFRSLVGRTFGWNVVLSNAFTLERRGDDLMIEGRGFGHQVGLCVEGAVAQARAGRGRREIVNFYFPRAVIARCGPPQ
jgi:stage II sporulation protein D